MRLKYGILRQMSYSIELDGEILEKTKTLSRFEEETRSEIQKKLKEFTSKKAVELNFAGQFDRRSLNEKGARQVIRSRGQRRRRRRLVRREFLHVLVFALALWVIQLYFFGK